MSNGQCVTLPFFISHAGCPHRCVFCDQTKISGSGGLLPSREEIAARITAFAETAGGRRLEVAFFGGSFTLLPEADRHELLEGVKPHLQSGTVTAIRISTRPDAVSSRIAAELAAAGVQTVELGVQSFDDEVLETARRGYRGDVVAESISVLSPCGISVGLQLMIGLPGDSPERAVNGMRRAVGLGASFFRIYPTLVIEGTELASLYRSGSFQPWSLETAAGVSAAMLREAYRAGLPVIRVGLQPTADLERPGTILAGPYHPAFRDLAEGVLRRRGMAAALAGETPKNVGVTVPPAELSWYIGHRRCNIDYFTDRNIMVSIAANPTLGKHTFRIEQGGVSRIINLLEE